MRRKPWLRVSVQDDLVGVAPEPTLAVKSLPREWSDTPHSVDGGGLIPMRTVHQCAPFFDAIALGVIIPFPFDVTVKVEEGAHVLRWDVLQTPTDSRVNGTYAAEVHSHDVRQHDRFYDRPTLKVLVPYYVESSPDLLVFYGPLVNRNTPLVPFSGVVNHGPDGYKAPVNIVCRWDGEDGTFTFKRGEPLAQLYAVPKSVAYSTGTITDSDALERQKHARLVSSTSGTYRLLWRHRRAKETTDG